MERKKIKELCHSVRSNLQINKLNDNDGNYPLYGASGLVKNIDFYMIDRPYVSIVKDGAGIGRVACHQGQSSIVGTMQAFINEDNVELRYLYYVLKHENLGYSENGCTIPHIYFKNFGEKNVNYYPIDKQKKIVNVLDNITNSIKSKQNELILLDELIKSRFIRQGLLA